MNVAVTAPTASCDTSTTISRDRVIPVGAPTTSATSSPMITPTATRTHNTATMNSSRNASSRHQLPAVRAQLRLRICTGPADSALATPTARISRTARKVIAISTASKPRAAAGLGGGPFIAPSRTTSNAANGAIHIRNESK